MRFIKSILPFAIVALFISFSFGSCKRSATGKAGSDTSAVTKDSLLAEVKEVIYPLPGPFELYQKLEDIGASYLGEVLNPIENIDKYYTEKNKALNLGTYAADLSYISTYNKNQEIQLYSRNLKTLMTDLSVNINFIDFYSEEMKQKLENKDTLVKVVTNVYYDAYKEMAAKGDPSLAALMLAGIWTEGLYIASHISDDTYNNNDIVKIILDQKNSLDIVLDMLEKTGGNEITNSLSKALGNIKAIYDEAGESITKEQLDKLTKAIEDIRASIIS
ncbi:MAG: hypothetical protein JXB00_11195 [Bacteroidales bacterium]|nr:hypothetical protein [Bacteroidales bacterium]